MKKRDSLDVMFSIMAVIGDAAAVFGGLLFATWLRFSSGSISLVHPPPADLYRIYTGGAAVATLIFLFVFFIVFLVFLKKVGNLSFNQIYDFSKSCVV